MPKVPTLAEKMRLETEEGRKRVLDEQAVQNDKEKQADLDLQKLERGYSLVLFEKVKVEIAKAAAQGKSNISFPIMDCCEEASPRWATLRAGLLRAILEKEGFKVEGHRSQMDPVGSDPIYTNTVYSLDFEISW